MLGSVKYYAGQYGVSSNTDADVIVIKADKDMATKWISSLDFDGNSDTVFDVYLDNRTLYGISNFANQYFWIYILNYNSRALVKSKCFKKNLPFLAESNFSQFASVILIFVTAYKSYIVADLSWNDYEAATYLMWISKESFDIVKLYSKSLTQKVNSFGLTDDTFLVFMNEMNQYTRVDFDANTLEKSNFIFYSSSVDPQVFHY